MGRLREMPPLLGRGPLYLDAGEAGLVDAKLPGGFLGEVDRPAIAGAAVVDPHGDAAAVLRVGDLDLGLERQRRVRRRQLLGVEALAVGGAVAAELGPVPRGDPAGAVGCARRPATHR